VVTIARDAGFTISSEELQRAQAEISDEELEDVAGGGFLQRHHDVIVGSTNCIGPVSCKK
jgi:hypothetical protein